MTPIATLELMEIRSDGEHRQIRAQIGTPHYDERGSWACPVLLTSVDGTVKEIHGEDSMQALLLAVRFIHSMLRSLLEKGSRLVDPLGATESPSDPDFPLEAYFGTIGQLGAAPNGGPAVRSGNSGGGGGPPSVS
jgi:hypothetical protein